MVTTLWPNLPKWGAAFTLALLLSACENSSDQAHHSSNLMLADAERVISAFYTFESEKLLPLLINAPESAPAILYYQGWAKGGNYSVLKRHPCVAESASSASCSITVDDDLVLALKRAHKVTDTFTMHFTDGKITSIETTSDDEPIYREAFDWVVQTNPELMTQDCDGFFADGATPAACARAMAAGYHQFMRR